MMSGRCWQIYLDRTYYKPVVFGRESVNYAFACSLCAVVTVGSR